MLVTAQTETEKRLLTEAEPILDALGLELSTAARAFLKAVVRERGLPLPLRLCPTDETRAAETLPDADDRLPDAAEADLPEEDAPEKDAGEDAESRTGVEDFVRLICAVPKGALTRWSDLESCLSARHGCEVRKPVRVRWPETTREGKPIPYWRVVTERGAVREDAVCPKGEREKRLRAEGHSFVKAGHGKFIGEKVADYKTKLVDLNSIAYAG